MRLEGFLTQGETSHFTYTDSGRLDCGKILSLVQSTSMNITMSCLILDTISQYTLDSSNQQIKAASPTSFLHTGQGVILGMYFRRSHSYFIN